MELSEETIDPRTGAPVKLTRTFTSKSKSLCDLDDSEKSTKSTVSSYSISSEDLEELDKQRELFNKTLSLSIKFSKMRESSKFPLPLMYQPICVEPFHSMYIRVNKMDIITALSNHSVLNDVEIVKKIYIPSGMGKPFQWLSQSKMIYFNGEKWLEDTNGIKMMAIIVKQLSTLYYGINKMDIFGMDEIIINNDYIKSMKKKSYNRTLYKELQS